MGKNEAVGHKNEKNKADSDTPALKIGDITDADITDMNEDGVGITKINSAVVFIDGAVTGDRVKIRIKSHEKNYYTAELLEIITPSEYRITDDCGDASVCGGCTLGHVSFEYENIIKKNTVISAFRRMGLSCEMISDTVSSSREGYRNKITLHCRDSVFGYYKKGTNELVNFGNCLLCPDSFNRIIGFVNSQMPKITELIPIRLQLRDCSSGKITVSIYTEKACPSGISANAENELISAFPQIESVSIMREGEKNEAAYINDRIGDLDMRFSSDAFRQVNTPVFEKLLEIICDFAAQETFSRAVDLYCGSGIIGLTLAKRFPLARLYGIEINPESIEDARYNARLNGLENIEFFTGDSADFLKKLPKGTVPELVLLDPPRAGLSKKMRADLTSLSPRTIIYVSCNPQTLARDAAELVKHGYGIANVVPVNMFPRTRHVETVCLLSKLKSTQHIEVDLSMDELDLTSAEKKATYQEIKDYVLEHTGLKVSSLYIAQVKQKRGIIERENYNKPKSEDARQPQCPPDREKAIKEALTHFGMI